MNSTNENINKTNQIKNLTTLKNEMSNCNFNYFSYINKKKDKKYYLNIDIFKKKKKSKENKILNIIMTPNKKLSQHQTNQKTFKNNKIKTTNSKTKTIKQFMKWHVKDNFFGKIKKLENNNNTLDNKKKFNSFYKSKSINIYNDSK